MSTVREDYFNIGARLKEERDRAGLTQEGLGTRIGTTGRTVKKYEANETSIRATELLQLANLDFDVMYIVTGVRSPPGCAQARVAYSVAEHLGEFISGLKLSEQDADLLRTLAARLAH